MVCPIRQGRHFARQCRQLTLKEVTEGLAQSVDIFAISIDKIHWNIERIVHIAFKPHAVLKDEWQHARAGIIQMTPDIAAPGFVIVHLALKEGRVRKQRNSNRLQRQGNTQFLHHVSLGSEIQVHLHRTGPTHHGAAHRADFLHIVVHQPIAAFRHQWHLVMRPDRSRTQTDELRPDLIGDILNLAQVDVHLVTGLMNCLQSGARKLKCPAGFQTDIRAFFFQADQLVRLHHRRPAVPITQPF